MKTKFGVLEQFDLSYDYDRDELDAGFQKVKPKTQKQIFDELEEYNLEDLEAFVRIKKLNRIKDKIK